MAPEANPGKRPRIATQQTAALTETSPSRGSTTSSTSSLSEEQLEQRLLLKMASMTSKGQTSAYESEDALEKRLMSKMESMISQLVGKAKGGNAAAASSAAARTAFPTKVASKRPAKTLSPIRSERTSTTVNALPAMTPSSKMMVAKAVLCQAKAYGLCFHKPTPCRGTKAHFFGVCNTLSLVSRCNPQLTARMLVPTRQPRPSTPPPLQSTAQVQGRRQA